MSGKLPFGADNTDEPASSSRGRGVAEEDLRWSEERFRLLVENIGDYALYMLDPEGRITTWNLGAQRLKGYAASEVIGRSFDIFFPPEDVDAGKPWKELEEARRHGRFEDEGLRIRKDGTCFWANAILTRMTDERGTLVGFAKVTRDLTERREAEHNARELVREQTARTVAEAAERKLRESEERYRALSNRLEIVLEGVADGITVQDRTGRVVFANSAAARICGFSSVEEFTNASPSEVLARFEILDDQGLPFKGDALPGRRVLAGEPSASAVVHVHERATGKHWSSLIRSSAVLGEDGKPDLAINIWHDVTTEHRAERAARFSAQASVALGSSTDAGELLLAFARVFVPALADWCSIYLLEGGTLRNAVSVHASPDKTALAREHQRRYPPDAEKSGVWNVIRSGVAELHNDISDEMLASATSDPKQLAILRSVGMKAIVLAPITLHSKVTGVISLISAESGRRYDASHAELLSELGEHVGMALEHASLYRAARVAAKVAEDASRAKDEFLATVSHELRTPLNAIVGWSTILKDRISDPTLLKPIQAIYRNGLAQVKIIEDILDVSRVITGKFRIDPRPVDLAQITRDATEVVRPTASAKSVGIELDLGKDFCFTSADAERLQQVVWNLLSNAVKFTPAGGIVRVSLRHDETEATLVVSDTGAGIASSFLPFVFDRFRQGDPSPSRRVGGLGLGLALVRHIVELHGGRVAAESAGPGRGSTFSVWLPLRAAAGGSSEESVQGPPRRAASGAGRLEGFEVLVVDDDEDTREVVVAVLEDAGARVRAAPSAPAALVALEAALPDVLVSDLAMPGEDGFSLIRKVRKLPGALRLPALAVTAYTREEDRRRAVDAGFSAHLGKPLDSEALVAAIAELRRPSSG